MTRIAMAIINSIREKPPPICLTAYVFGFHSLIASRFRLLPETLYSRSSAAVTPIKKILAELRRTFYKSIDEILQDILCNNHMWKLCG